MRKYSPFSEVEVTDKPTYEQKQTNNQRNNNKKRTYSENCEQRSGLRTRQAVRISDSPQRCAPKMVYPKPPLKAKPAVKVLNLKFRKYPLKSALMGTLHSPTNRKPLHWTDTLFIQTENHHLSKRSSVDKNEINLRVSIIFKVSVPP